MSVSSLPFLTLSLLPTPPFYPLPRQCMTKSSFLSLLFTPGGLVSVLDCTRLVGEELVKQFIY